MGKQVISSGLFTSLKTTNSINFNEITFKTLNMIGDNLNMIASNTLLIDTPEVLVSSVGGKSFLGIETPNQLERPEYNQSTILAIRNNLETDDGCDFYITSGATGKSNIFFNRDRETVASVSYDSVQNEFSLANSQWRFVLPKNNITPTPGMCFGVESVEGSDVRLKMVNPRAMDVLINRTNRLFVPLYVYPDGPGGVYNQVGAGMATLSGRLDVVINPNNGDDATSPPNGDWVRDLNGMQTSAGGSWSTKNVWGYTYTGYGTRNAQDVLNVIDGYMSQGWEAWVGGGFFFDETSNDVQYLEYYNTILDYIASRYPGMKVIFNSGVTLYPELAENEIVEAVCNFENTFAALDTYKAPDYQLFGVPDGFVTIINEAASAADVPVVFEKARSQNSGRIYVTDIANYNTLSPYFGDMVGILV